MKKPVIDITIPIKCSTVTKTSNKIGHTLKIIIDPIIEGVFNLIVKCAENLYIHKIMRVIYDIMVISFISIVYFIIGELFIGSFFTLILGTFGGRTVSLYEFGTHPIVVLGGIAGTILLWAALLLSAGTISIHCIREKN